MLLKLSDKRVLAEKELKSIKIRGKEFLLTILEGKVYCLDGRCTHAGAPLAEGSLEGEVLTCPWHYSQFNITNGSVLRGPALQPLKTYIVIEKDDSILIDL